jgi:methyl-accepting chemotaxis protein
LETISPTPGLKFYLAVTAENITVDVTGVADISKETEDQANNIAKDSSELASLAEQLSAEIARFKV